MGNDNIVHIASVGASDAWAARLKTLLRSTNSKTIRSRFEATDRPDSKLWDLAWQVSITFALCNLAVSQVKAATHEILLELQDRKDEIPEAMADGSCFTMRQPHKSSLAALLAVDSFLFEFQSATEKLEKFLELFWNEIFHENFDRTTLNPTLNRYRAKVDWIGKLKNRRANHFHEATPWVAVRITSIKPLQGGIVLLDEQDHPTGADLLDEIANGFLKFSMATIEFVEKQITNRDDRHLVRECLSNGSD